MLITGSSTAATDVAGNLIGTNVEGTAAVGNLTATAVAKTAQQLKFEAERVTALNLKSEEEAKQELAKFTAQQEQERLVAAFVDANLGLTAAFESVGDGQNFLHQSMPKRIPLLKALLPKEAAVAGKLIQLNGYVFKLAETEYGSIAGVDKSCYLMAIMQPDEMPTEKIPGMGLFGALGTLLTAAR